MLQIRGLGYLRLLRTDGVIEAAIGGAAAIWPLAVRARQQAMPIIGFLGSASAGANAHLGIAFRPGLNEAGYVDGENAAIECRDYVPGGSVEALGVALAGAVRGRRVSRVCCASSEGWRRTSGHGPLTSRHLGSRPDSG